MIATMEKLTQSTQFDLITKHFQNLNTDIKDTHISHSQLQITHVL